MANFAIKWLPLLAVESKKTTAQVGDDLRVNTQWVATLRWSKQTSVSFVVDDNEAGVLKDYLSGFKAHTFGTSSIPAAMVRIPVHYSKGMYESCAAHGTVDVFIKDIVTGIARGHNSVLTVDVFYDSYSNLWDVLEVEDIVMRDGIFHAVTRSLEDWGEKAYWPIDPKAKPYRRVERSSWVPLVYLPDGDDFVIKPATQLNTAGTMLVVLPIHRLRVDIK